MTHSSRAIADATAAAPQTRRGVRIGLARSSAGSVQEQGCALVSAAAGAQLKGGEGGG